MVLAASLEAGFAVQAVGLNPATEQGRIDPELPGNEPEAVASVQKGLDRGEFELLGVLDHVGRP